jgi:hypothetical protein
MVPGPVAGKLAMANHIVAGHVHAQLLDSSATCTTLAPRIFGAIESVVPTFLAIFARATLAWRAVR